jgi:hypothetical protein
MNRERLWRRCAILATETVVVVACGWIFGFDRGLLFPIAIGVATAVAVFSDPRGTCSPRFPRRRD